MLVCFLFLFPSGIVIFGVSSLEKASSHKDSAALCLESDLCSSVGGLSYRVYGTAGNFNMPFVNFQHLWLCHKMCKPMECWDCCPVGDKDRVWFETYSLVPVDGHS